MQKYLLVICLMMSFTTQAQANKTALASVDSLLHAIYSDNDPGVAFAIENNNALIFQHSYGVINTGTQQKITAQSCFNIGSLTKQFTAMCILQLQYAGKLSLNDKLSKFFPELNKKIADKVTVQQLLTHSSGIVDHYNYTDTKNMRHAHIADVLQAIKNVDSAYFKPGTQFRYSNTGFCLLALIIERISGMPYALYLQKNIFGPAEMMHSFVWSENTTIPNMVTGYELDSATKKFTVSGPDESIFFSTEGDGGIYTTLDDYSKWFNALQGGKVFTSKLVSTARSMHFLIDTPKHAGYGYGWFVDDKTMAAKVYHSGSNGGFRAYSFTIPQSGYAVIILSNRGDIDLDELVEKINKILIPAEAPFTKITALVQ